MLAAAITGVISAACTPAGVPVNLTPQATSTSAVGDGTLVVRQPGGKSCTVGVSGWDFDDSRYANAKFICPVTTGVDLVLHTKRNAVARDDASRYLVDGYLIALSPPSEVPLWRDDIYVYPPTGLVSYDYKVDDRVLEIKSTRGDSGGYREERWYVNLGRPQLLLNFVYVNEPKISLQRKGTSHVIGISGIEDKKGNTYILTAVTKDGLTIHNLPSQPVKLENPCEINCIHIPEFENIVYNAQDQSLSFNVSSARANYGQVKVMIED